MSVMGKGQQLRHSDALKWGARVGLVAYGVVHLVIAWIALQIAWSGGGDASGGGAMKKLADQPLGATLLWVTVVGLLALAAWQLMAAIWGYQTETDDKKRAMKRASSVGRVLVYVLLMWTALKVVTGSGGSTGGDSGEEGLTAKLMGASGGRLLVTAVGVAILVVAFRQVRRGVTERFTHDLEPGATSGDSGSAILLMGRVGYVAKGAAIGIVGLLFGWAAITYDPDKAGGLDDALQKLRDQPFGPILLTAVALGFVAFGGFCFAWARYARTR